MQHNIQLFQEGYLRTFFENILLDVEKYIDSLPEDYILAASTDALCEKIESSFAPIVPYIDMANITQDYHEETRHQPTIIGGHTRYKGTEYEYYLPFTGNSELFRYQPSTCQLDMPAATITENSIILDFWTARQDEAELKRQLDKALGNIEVNLAQISKDVEVFKESLKQKARRLIDERKDRILASRRIVASIGYPLKRQSEAQFPYPVPLKRKGLPIERILADVAPFRPEHVLDEAIYNEILSDLWHMSLVIERNPESFASFGEETIRDVFLIPLNCNYRGSATGETFNREGKTDILIRVEDRTIFIAECKFWRGPKSLTEAIDQIQGYQTWRDSKLAILLFYRGKNLSQVLEKIPETVEQHPHCKKELPYESETGFRFRFRHKDDELKESVLTILVFEIPE